MGRRDILHLVVEHTDANRILHHGRSVEKPRNQWNADLTYTFASSFVRVDLHRWATISSCSSCSCLCVYVLAWLTGYLPPPSS